MLKSIQNFFKNFNKSDVDLYLEKATDHCDLERRLRKIKRKL